MYNELLYASYETVIMVALSGLVSLILGLPLAGVLYATRPGRQWQNAPINQTLGLLVNVIRSFPFFILMIALMPVMGVLLGTTLGIKAATFSLAIAATPFLARIIESAFNEVPIGLIEAAQSMGASPLQIFRKVLIPEALPGIVSGLAVTLITLVGYSAMAGAIGGGGLGSMAYHRGYQRFDTETMVVTIVVLIVMVQLIQWLGDRFVHHILKR